MSSSPESQSPSSPDSPRHLAWPVPPGPVPVPITVTHYNSHTRQHTTSTQSTTPTAGPSPSGGPTMIKSRRFYSSPLSETPNPPDANTNLKTPLQAYGLEQREPSIAEEKPHLLRRVSHALDDIKEDFTLGLDPKGTAEKIRSRRRGSVFFEAPPSSSPAPAAASRPESARPLSIFSTAGSIDQGGSVGRRMSRRFSMFGGGFAQRRKRVGESISQPNLIGSSTHL